jgi:hypothetical protein
MWPAPQKPVQIWGGRSHFQTVKHLYRSVTLVVRTDNLATASTCGKGS